MPVDRRHCVHGIRTTPFGAGCPRQPGPVAQITALDHVVEDSQRIVEMVQVTVLHRPQIVVHEYTSVCGLAAIYRTANEFREKPR